ncbi:DUF3369 domain-containing protein [Aestuariirhabdus sp. Z084]|uniref:DUF3369 domain-containing protein n=1 Tax=Aestuariirhabdus haliotis TaxID=2918751 RepID=UPI00201B3FC6|nr:DUF3369 domain-containing protein [Aestuariirhabdus haliotis]MCL6416694.1 DUF3369 domain-containing protein [Aestuariirhabdus haliotis]MCL6420717.1 DUF3369 domain-containing protein [Aestuariirhabdus haliotis]
MDDTSDFLFADELPDTVSTEKDAFLEQVPWKVLVVDDEEEVHSVTRLVLSDYHFGGRPLEIISAYSAQEARQVLKQHPDTAVALVDVVMETDHAGLELVKSIREELTNTRIRVVLRTGQPGQAPEETVISDYDINDYKDKTELTATKLRTLMYSTLRSFRDITALEASRRGLEQVILSSAHIFEITSLQRFASAVLLQLTSLLNLSENAAYFRVSSGFAVTRESNGYHVLAGTGNYEPMIDTHSQPTDLPDGVFQALELATQERCNQYFDDHMVAYFQTRSGQEHLLFISNAGRLNDLDRQLIEIFCANVAIAFENTHLKDELEQTQQETVYMLGEAIESRSRETGNHVKRVAEISHLLALKAGLSTETADTIKLASPLHDLGKVGIPDAILNKPERHTEKEWEVMQRHVGIGYEMLRTSNRPVLRTAAIIAQQHHEHWDGGGYPNGLKQEEIHIAGRITAIADVFDALSSDRCYKPAWKLDDVLSLFHEERGKQFDPNLVDLMMDHIDDILFIRDRYQDNQQPTLVPTPPTS